MNQDFNRDEAIRRVQEMEIAFDALQQVWAKDPGAFRADEDVRQLMQSVTAYYDGGLWQADYRLDEQGVFPDGMKRGILSEDGFYNFLCDVEAFLRQTEGTE